MERKAFRRLRLSYAILLLGLVSCSGAPARSSSSTETAAAAPAPAELLSSQTVEGGILLVRLANEVPGVPVSELRVSYQGRETRFFEIAAGRFAALVGVPYETAPGTFSLSLLREGYPEPMQVLPFTVTSGEYETEVLKVPPRKVSPTKKDMIRIKREQAEIGRIYRTVHFEKLWSGPFQLPVNSVVTSKYGNKRLFNGQLQSFHNGLDLRAPTGTPIAAPAIGEVVLAKDLFYTGNTVILSHGFGLYTVYAHMSVLKVKKGMKVAPGRVLGLSGQTGRSSGPHLHWGVVIQQVKVDPAVLMKVLQ